MWEVQIINVIGSSLPDLFHILTLHLYCEECESWVWKFTAWPPVELSHWPLLSNGCLTDSLQQLPAELHPRSPPSVPATKGTTMLMCLSWWLLHSWLKCSQPLTHHFFCGVPGPLSLCQFTSILTYFALPYSSMQYLKWLRQQSFAVPIDC